MGGVNGRADLEIGPKERIPGCRGCIKLQAKIDKLVAETRIIIAQIQKAAKRRSKPVQELVEINKEIADALDTLSKCADEQEKGEVDSVAFEQKIAKKTVEIEEVIQKPLLLVPKGQGGSIVKGIGVGDDYDDYEPDCLKCDDTGYIKNAGGIKVPCQYCNPGGQAVTIPGEHIQCPWCNAKKEKASFCLKCNGCGHVPYKNVYDAKGTCIACGGKGVTYEDAGSEDLSPTETTCDVCLGVCGDPKKVWFAGNATKPLNKGICDVCYGKGTWWSAKSKAPVQCWKCDGKG